ncbi:MAG TPA: permease prefix domain 1-containing protein [Planctomycetaceae bacterium]|nr:permease prefix domain 1-containing protein [Planctomycetaceae bacterium]
MDWREAAASGLPAPRDDEPAGLRQEILDELADHLECALKRELTKNITPEEAVENVKRRFGNPRDLARRLWLDAMKDSIMSKRLTLAAMGLMTVMCLLLGWIAWTSQRASQEAAESIRKTNAELVEKLSALLAARPAPAAGGPERAQVHFHLVHDDAKSSPAQGIEATFFLNGAGSNLAALKRTSDENGNLDFGMLPAGSYLLKLTTPWQESTLIPLQVSPAFPITSPIVCPAQDWPPVDVEFEFTGLPPLKNSDSLIVCRIGSMPTRKIGDDGWSHPNPSGGPEEEFDVVLDSAGRIIDFGTAAATDPRGGGTVKTRFWLRRGSGADGPWFQTLVPSKRLDWLFQRHKLDGPPHNENVPQLNFRARNYDLKWVMVLLAPDLRRLAGESNRDAVPKTLLTWVPGETPFVLGVNLSGDFYTAPLRPIPGRKNVWNIKISSDSAGEISRMLLSSASRVPPPANDAVATSEAAAGAALLKTLEAEALQDRTPDGFSGLKLTSIEGARLTQAGLKKDDVVIGVEGWNVNNNRELGFACRHPINAPDIGAETAAVPAELLILVWQRGKILLYSVPTSKAPTEEPAKPSKASAPAKASAESVDPQSRFHSHRRVVQPGQLDSIEIDSPPPQSRQ